MRKDGGDDDSGGADFKDQPRSNETHASNTDADARLYCKGDNASRLRYMGHTLTDNRHGLVANAVVTVADGFAEREAAKAMINDAVQAAGNPNAGITLGADKGYDAKEFIDALQEMNVIPHVAQNTSGRRSAVPDSIAASAGYAISVQKRKLIGFGRIRIHRIQGPTIDALIPFVRENVMPGATIRTDGSAIYAPLQKDGFGHEPFVQLGSKIPAHVSLPGVHRVISLLKRWLLGTHQGAVDPRHVDYYLDEFAFRFNRRSSRSRGMLFYRLLQQSAATTPTTYANIRDNEHPALAALLAIETVELNG